MASKTSGRNTPVVETPVEMGPNQPAQAPATPPSVMANIRAAATMAGIQLPPMAGGANAAALDPRSALNGRDVPVAEQARVLDPDNFDFADPRNVSERPARPVAETPRDNTPAPAADADPKPGVSPSDVLPENAESLEKPALLDALSNLAKRYADSSNEVGRIVDRAETAEERLVRMEGEIDRLRANGDNTPQPGEIVSSPALEALSRDHGVPADLLRQAIQEIAAPVAAEVGLDAANTVFRPVQNATAVSGDIRGALGSDYDQVNTAVNAFLADHPEVQADCNVTIEQGKHSQEAYARAFRIAATAYQAHSGGRAVAEAQADATEAKTVHSAKGHASVPAGASTNLKGESDARAGRELGAALQQGQQTRIYDNYRSARIGGLKSVVTHPGLQALKRDYLGQ